MLRGRPKTIPRARKEDRLRPRKGERPSRRATKGKTPRKGDRLRPREEKGPNLRAANRKTLVKGKMNRVKLSQEKLDQKQEQIHSLLLIRKPRAVQKPTLRKIPSKIQPLMMQPGSRSSPLQRP